MLGDLDALHSEVEGARLAAVGRQHGVLVFGAWGMGPTRDRMDSRRFATPPTVAVGRFEGQLVPRYVLCPPDAIAHKVVGHLVLEGPRR